MDDNGFNTFYSKILKLKKNDILKVASIGRKAVFMASYTTKHYPDDEYLKLFFADGALLEIMPGQKEVFFCDDKRRNLDRNLVKDDGKYLDVDGKRYSLDNANDTQIIKKVYFGDITDGESGCVFSDYSFEDEIWSLAVLENGEISDVHARRINVKDINF